MKKITLQIFAFLAFVCCWQTNAQSIINITTSGGSFATEKWVNVTTEINGGGTQIWGQGDGTYGNGPGLINQNITLPAGTYYVNCYDKYADGWDGTLISATAYGNILNNNGGVSPNDGTDTDTSFAWGDTQAQELEASLVIIVPVAPCVSTAIASSTVVDDCGASQFSIDVLISDAGDGSNITDGLGGSFPIASGTVTAGPYTIGDVITLEVEHTNALCDYTLGTYSTGCTIPGEICENSIIIGGLPYSTTDNTSNYGDDYSGSPGASDCGTTSGYLGGDDVVYSYTAISDTSINVSMTPTGTWSGIFVYTDCADIGVACATGVSGSSTAARNFDLTVSNGTTYYFVISTFPSPQSTAYTLNIVENTCTAATVNYVIVDDCDVSGGFYIDVNISDLGSATALTISDDQGSTPQALTAVGTVTFGPFVNATNVVITILDDNDGNCTIVSSVLTQTVCPPSNTNCATAEAITVGLGVCGPTVTGNNTGATDSGEADPSCGNYAGGDIWYSFVVPADRSQVTVELGTSAFSTTKMAVYNTTMPCGSLVEIFCDNLYTTKTVTGLTSGDTYLLRLYDWGNDDLGEVTFCVSTLASCPAPTGIVVTNRATTSADLNWTENGTAALWDIEWGATGFTATGTPTIEDTATKPYGFTGLTASTAYDFYVRSDCGGGDVSAWVGPFTFATTDLPPACGGNFYDEGGLAGDYSNNSNITTTICPDLPGDTVNVNFTFFSTENRGATDCWDGLTIHDGPDATAATIDPPGGGTRWCWDRDDTTPGGTGDLQGMTITSTDPSGCLTFVFTSDGSGLREGWEANVTCTALSLLEFGLTGFTYFPNPVTNSLSLRGVQNIQNVAVYNMLGQEVLRTVPNNAASDIDMSNLQTGAYFVKVTIENTTKTIRIIKN
ncbi:T9SS type A sorting domain-containing protein [Bizionia myxarmorum]|uniref:T9SS type A sorting domain-containing protein n=1 Tax=Bizionia myxarmorum TaxID=291186 RepID=A0A5D0R7Z2_9FLAO|nr:T9SS type A sorting domain-containing protein [Bizionia myxarmorum]TYB77199.1 T9SS type A sorting domain-containing protein [Bizionia myxarmorum]